MFCEMCYYYGGYTITSLKNETLPNFFMLYEQLQKIKADDTQDIV